MGLYTHFWVGTGVWKTNKLKIIVNRISIWKNFFIFYTSGCIKLELTLILTSIWRLKSSCWNIFFHWNWPFVTQNFIIKLIFFQFYGCTSWATNDYSQCNLIHKMKPVVNHSERWLSRFNYVVPLSSPIIARFIVLRQYELSETPFAFSELEITA